MIDYNVGDCIITEYDYMGEIVYISSVFPCNVYLKIEKHYQSEWCYTKEEFDKAIENGEFKRIGAHDFTVKENKIEPLETIMEKHDGYSVNGMLKDAIISKRLPNTFEMIDKINEIIAYINKEDK